MKLGGTEGVGRLILMGGGLVIRAIRMDFRNDRAWSPRDGNDINGHVGSLVLG